MDGMTLQYGCLPEYREEVVCCYTCPVGPARADGGEELLNVRSYVRTIGGDAFWLPGDPLR